MVTITEPAALVFDTDTEQKIDRLSKLWNVSSTEVIRRSISEADRLAVSVEPEALSPLEALARLQALACLTREQAEEWKRDIREGWDEAFAREEQKRATRGKA